jgi:protein-tyrosine phosphatase
MTLLTGYLHLIMKSFLNLFKNPLDAPEKLQLDWLEVDMHSHLIPGIDDGSKSMEESIELIRRMESYGLRKIITTPHVMSEYYRNTSEVILEGLQALKSAVEKEGIGIEIEAAAEYYLDELFLEKLKRGEKLLSIGNGLVLVETGFMNKPQMLLEVFFEMELLGYTPVLAHPERYQYLIGDKGLQTELTKREIFFQVNMLSFTGFYSKAVKNFAEMLLDEGKIKLLGTDCHNHRYLDTLETLPNVRYYNKIRNLELLNRSL